MSMEDFVYRRVGEAPPLKRPKSSEQQPELSDRTASGT
jgi:hypothetical protein